ncbi:MAG: hypothetical protein KDD62_07885 [Bdellovibrionales bacterium]|nr:hypothetical protein [Bdellovibrionales bacterium]
MLSNASWEMATIFIGGIATLAIYSFFIKENPFYRFFEHIYIGIAAGFGPIFALKYFFWPNVIEPLFGLNIVEYPDGTLSHPYNSYYLLYLLPMAFGLLYYTIYIKRFSWMVKIVIGFALGSSAALAFKGFFNEIIPQLSGSFKPLVVYVGSEINWQQSFENMFFVTTLLLVMYYFFFTFRRGAELSGKVSFMSRWLMMICFGAFFGSTVQARLMLLIERLNFLINEWTGLFL